MYATTNTGVLFWRPCGVERRGIRIGPRIAICGAQQAANLIATLQGDAAQFRVLVNPPRKHMQRRVMAQDLFCAAVRHFMNAGFQECLDPISKGVNRCFVTCIQ